jgi:FMN reductase
MRATVVVGNPKLDSRTRAAGFALATTMADTVSVVEVGSLTGLLDRGDRSVAEAKSLVLDADLIVFASPVYKASYTGLLKAFLDHFGRDELAGKATVPLMVGASMAHSLAVELQLRPVLVEIGASCPTRGVYVLESEVASVSFDEWLAVWGAPLRAVMQAGRPAE